MGTIMLDGAWWVQMAKGYAQACCSWPQHRLHHHMHVKATATTPAVLTAPPP
jgi:hypothetical protein